MQPGPAQVHHQFTVLDIHPQVAEVEAEQPEKADEVGLHIGDALEEGQFLGGHLQLGQRFDLVADLAQVRAQVFAGAAAKGPFHFRIGVVMQDRLHHGELVEVGIQQALDDAVRKCAAHRVVPFWTSGDGSGKWRARRCPKAFGDSRCRSRIRKANMCGRAVGRNIIVT